MDKELFFNNKKYISSKYAGKISGYTNDYVARLVRQKKVSGKMVGRTWYVEEKSLNDFIEHNKLQKQQLHEKLSNRRIQEYKYSEQDKRTREAFRSVASKISQACHHEFVKKGIAGAVSLLVVFGGYFAVDTGIAKTGFKKISNAVVISINTITAFDPNDFAKDAAVNIHNGINKTKHSIEYTAVAVHEFPYDDMEDYVQSTSANVFTGIVGSIKKDITTVVKDEAVYVYTKTNEILCSTFFLPKTKMCSRDQSDIVLVQSESQEQKQEIKKVETPEVPRTVISQPVIERVVETERVLTISGITREDMEIAIQQLKNKVYSDMSNLTSANETRIINNYSTIAKTNKIDKLGNVTISNSTITGTLSGLTDDHIPNDITISGYLALAGGTLTGALLNSSTATSTFSGGLSMDVLNVSTTTATSTLANGINISDGCFSIDGTCVSAGGGGGRFWNSQLWCRGSACILSIDRYDSR